MDLNLSFPIFSLYLEQPFHCPCTSLYLPKLPSKKQPALNYFFLVDPNSATSPPKDTVVFTRAVSFFAGYYRYSCLGTSGLASLHMPSIWFILEKLVNFLRQIPLVMCQFLYLVPLKHKQFISVFQQS